MPTVFLAYARANKTVVHEIANDLSAEGLDVSWDDDLESGDWRRELRARIKAADHLVWIMSRQSSHSKAVRAEFDIATEAGTHTHVLCIDGVEKEATDCVGDDVLALNWIPRSRLPKLIRAMRGTPGRPPVSWAVAAAVLAVVGLVSVVSLSGRSGTSPRPAKSYDRLVEVLLDGSGHMVDRFDGRTRWSAAIEELNGYLYTQDQRRTGIALRVFGGECDGDGEQSRLLIDFDDDFMAKHAVGDYALSGESTLIRSLAKAVGDLYLWQGDSWAPSAGALSVVVITGRGDTCHPDQIEYVRREIESKGISVDFHFVVMSSEPESRALATLAAALGGEAHFVTARTELHAAVQPLLGLRKLNDVPTSTPQSAKLVDGVDDRQESEPASESLDAPPTIGPKEREQETGPLEARLPTIWPTSARGGTSRAHASHFHLTGEYDVYVKGEKVAADVLFSQRAASYVVTLPDEKHAYVLRQRSRSIGQVALESLKRRDDGYVELSPGAPMKALGRFRLAGQDVVIHVDGFDGRLKPRPPLLEHHTGPQLLAHSPQYAINQRSYRSNAGTIQKLKSAGHKAEVEVFFGTWCSRCARLLGHVLYVEEALGKSGIAFKYYGLPRPPAAWSEAHYRASGVRGLPAAVVRVDGKVRGRIAPGGWSSFESSLLPLVR